MRTKLLLGSVALWGALSAPAAQAGVYDFTFTSNDRGPVTSMVGTFTTLATPTHAGVEITGMSGTLFGVADTVLGVVGNSNYPSSSYSLDGAFIYDDALFSGQPYLDNPGVLFQTENNPTGYWNLFSVSRTLYDLYESVPGSGYVVAETGTLRVAGIPEASTWAMLLMGFAGLGFAGYRKATAFTDA